MGCSGIFRDNFVELKEKIRVARGGKLDDISRDLLREHIQFLIAKTSTFPATWPEDLRLRYDKAAPPSDKKQEWGRYDPGRLEHYTILHGIYSAASLKMQASDAAFQAKKVAAAKSNILGDSDQEWIVEILDTHHTLWEINLVKEKNYELRVLWLKHKGETAEFDKDGMAAFWRARQAELAAKAFEKTSTPR